MKVSDASFFITIPSIDSRCHWRCTQGLLKAQRRWPDRHRFDFIADMGISNARDAAAAAFLQSGATHWLTIDDDTGWKPEDAEMLVELGVGCALGVYSEKNEGGRPVLRPVPPVQPPVPFNTESGGAGFQLCSRELIIRMFEFYSGLAYKTAEKGIVTRSIHQQYFCRGRYQGEDTSFHCRVREMGEKVWVHPDVILAHADKGKVFYPKWKPCAKKRKLGLCELGRDSYCPQAKTCGLVRDAGIIRKAVALCQTF